MATYEMNLKEIKRMTKNEVGGYIWITYKDNRIAMYKLVEVRHPGEVNYPIERS